MRDLKSKVAVVTGGSQGIGKAIAAALVREGAHVAIVASRQNILDQAAAEIQAGEGRVLPIACDLRNTDAWYEAHSKIVETLGPVDILVNNVGTGTFKPMHLQSREEAMLPVQLPFGIAVATCHACIPSMLERGAGHILNLTSPAGLMAIPNMMPYAAARHAMVGLSHSLWEELHSKGIGVTLLCPGQVNTAYFDHNDADMDWYPRLAKVFPVLEAEDVGRVAVRAIKENRREMIYPLMLEAMVRSFTVAPRLWTRIFNITGLWKPSREA